VLGGLPAERLVLEMTEHARVDDYPALKAALGTFRERGVRLAIDDAGAGFASLRHIVLLHPDFIKLDMTLTRDVHVDETRRALVAALVAFGSQIGAKVVAEGVEFAEQLATLRQAGVQFGQGFYLAGPRLYRTWEPRSQVESSSWPIQELMARPGNGQQLRKGAGGARWVRSPGGDVPPSEGGSRFGSEWLA
jgi:EAL domain-containing protein (putative c-di-GMP-specific phosphodiesterase class I)